jgi:hypothetical protein
MGLGVAVRRNVNQIHAENQIRNVYISLINKHGGSRRREDDNIKMCKILSVWLWTGFFGLRMGSSCELL